MVLLSDNGHLTLVITSVFVYIDLHCRCRDTRTSRNVSRQKFWFKNSVQIRYLCPDRPLTQCAKICLFFYSISVQLWSVFNIIIQKIVLKYCWCSSIYCCSLKGTWRRSLNWGRDKGRDLQRRNSPTYRGHAEVFRFDRRRNFSRHFMGRKTMKINVFNNCLI